MKSDVQKQLNLVDWKNLGEEEIPRYILAYTSKNPSDVNKACNYFDSRTISTLVRSEEYGPLSELLAKEGLVFAVPILLFLLDHPDFTDKSAIIENLNEIARNIISEIPNTKEPYFSRANRIMASLKSALPVFNKILVSNIDGRTNKLIHELLSVLKTS